MSNSAVRPIGTDEDVARVSTVVGAVDDDFVVYFFSLEDPFSKRDLLRRDLFKEQGVQRWARKDDGIVSRPNKISLWKKLHVYQLSPGGGGESVIGDGKKRASHYGWEEEEIDIRLLLTDFLKQAHDFHVSIKDVGDSDRVRNLE